MNPLFKEMLEEPELKTFEIRYLTEILEEINNLSHIADEIPEKSRGNHRYGHQRIQWCFNRVSRLMTQEIRNKPVKDYFYNQAPALRYNGYRILHYGHPLPKSVLVRGTQLWGGNMLINEIISGNPGGMHRFFPVCQKLMTDNSNALFVDAMAVSSRLETYTENHNSRKWYYVYDVYDSYAQIILEKPYFIEKAKLFELMLLANHMKLTDVLHCLGMKIFSDFLSVGTCRNRFDRSLPPHLLELVMQHAWMDTLPSGPLSSKRSITDAAYRALEEELKTITEPLWKIYNTPFQSNGLLAERSVGSVLLGARYKCPDALTYHPDTEKLAAISAKVLVRMTEIIENDGGSSRQTTKRTHPAVDVSDLQSQSPIRKWLAAVSLSTDYRQYFESSGLKDQYETSGKDAPDCPMPHESPVCFPVEGRFKASLFSQLISDLETGSGIVLPMGMFFPMEDIDTVNESDAVKAMLKDIRTYCHHLIAIHGLQQDYPMDQLIDAWLSFHEYILKYVPCGVSSLSDLLWGLFFSSEPVFESFLTFESEALASRFRNVRQILTELPPKIREKRWIMVKKDLTRIYHQLKQMGLQIISEKENEAPLISNPFTSTDISPFSPPEHHFSKKVVQTRYSRSPIEVVEAPPGDAGRYMALVKSYQPQIKMLRRLHAEPLEEAANLVGLSPSGPFWDQNQMDVLTAGDCVFSTVAYHPPQPCPDQPVHISILLDMSGSMDRGRVASAKSIGIILAEALAGKFEIDFYMYNTAGSFYRLNLLMRTRNKGFAGKTALASITRNGLDTGSGWNPDAAVLNYLHDMWEKETTGPVILIFIGDHEYCKSLVDGIGCDSAEDEVHFMLREILKNNRFHAVFCRVGKDEDPLGNTPDLSHQYVYIPDTGISEETMKEIYGAIQRCLTVTV